MLQTLIIIGVLGGIWYGVRQWAKRREEVDQRVQKRRIHDDRESAEDIGWVDKASGRDRTKNEADE